MTSLHHSKTWLASTLVFVMVASLPAGVPDVIAKENRRTAKWDSQPGSRHIMDCERAGLCLEEQKLLMPSDNQSDERLGELIREGCRVRHALRGLISLSCPKSLDVKDARPERVFRAIGLKSAMQINAHNAWTGTGSTTGKGIRVAVLDTGVEDTHPDLAGRVVASVNFTDDSMQDALGHGTHVAGIIAGTGLKDIDGDTAHGVSADVELLVGKVCGNDGWCFEGDILAGMEWAVSVKADIANMSFGGGDFGDHCDGDTLANKANWMVSQGVTVVAAAGNNSAGVGTPACASKAIAVGAIDANNDRAPWSSYGKALDVVAPGVSVLSTYSCIAAGTCPNPAYGWMSGTSMSSPHVVGTVALLLQKYPQLTPDQILIVVKESAVDLGQNFPDQFYGYGRVDVPRALAKAAELFPELVCEDLDGDGYTTCASDCNDADAFINPDSKEICNGVDDNCNSQRDESCQFKFCGDYVCEGAENAKSCPSDCQGQQENAEKGKEKATKKEKPYVVCGDGTCESRERRSCPRDCGYEFIRSLQEEKLSGKKNIDKSSSKTKTKKATKSGRAKGGKK
ncbi:hypothetical protein COU79_03980 [Candidatus Peregrinibacteria bacterium CG10_big_fil_rev_8_21_14_0_10_54_7]|nr:MAG: hypothetical protein COU79_03980 [Candidatus Peregrinibacteria bacterium CG10_big_fil_rev_8_21_14_0_10_54_7]